MELHELSVEVESKLIHVLKEYARLAYLKGRLALIGLFVVVSFWVSL